MIKFTEKQTLLGDFLVFDKETGLFYDPKLNRIVSLENVQEFEQKIKESDDTSLQHISNTLCECLKEVQQSSIYHDFDRPGKNVGFLNRAMDMLKPLNTPVYVCQFCFETGGFIEDTDHFRFCHKFTKHHSKDQMFRSYLAYGFDGTLSKPRNFLVIRPWKDSLDGPRDDFFRSQLKWDKDILTIANIIKFHKKQRIFANISGFKIINPFSEEMEMFLMENEVPEFDSILYVVDQNAIWEETPNYYKRFKSDGKVKYIDEEIEIAVPEKGSIFVCRSCKEFVARSHYHGLLEHVESCTSPTPRYAVSKFSQYYELETLDEEGNNPISQYIINRKTLKKFLGINELRSEKFALDKKGKSNSTSESNVLSDGDVEQISDDEFAKEAAKNMDLGYHEDAQQTDRQATPKPNHIPTPQSIIEPTKTIPLIPKKATTNNQNGSINKNEKHLFNESIQKDQIDPMRQIFQNETDDGELADIETPAPEEFEDYKGQDDQDWGFDYGKEDEYNKVYRDDKTNDIKLGSDASSEIQSSPNKNSSIKLVKIESDGEFSYSSSDIEELKFMTSSQLHTPTKKLQNFNLNSTSDTIRPNSHKRSLSVSSSSSIELLYEASQGAIGQKILEQSSDFIPGSTSPLAKGTDIDESDNGFNDTTYKIDDDDVNDDDVEIGSDEITRDYDKYVLNIDNDNDEEEDSKSDDDSDAFYTPREDPYEKEYPIESTSDFLQSSPPISPMKPNGGSHGGSISSIQPPKIPIGLISSSTILGSPTKKQKIERSLGSEDSREEKPVKLPFFKLIPINKRDASEEEGEFSDW